MIAQDGIFRPSRRAVGPQAADASLATFDELARDPDKLRNVWALNMALLRARIEGRRATMLFDGAPPTCRIVRVDLGPPNELPQRHPTRAEIEHVLLNAARYQLEVSEGLAGYIRERRAGTIKVPVGKRANPYKDEQAIITHLWALWRVERRRGAYERLVIRNPKRANRNAMKHSPKSGWRVRAPKDRALLRVAKKIIIGRDSLADILKHAQAREGYRALMTIARGSVRYSPSQLPALPVLLILLGGGPDPFAPTARPRLAEAIAADPLTHAR